MPRALASPEVLKAGLYEGFDAVLPGLIENNNQNHLHLKLN